MGIAVQDNNLADINPKTGKRVTVPELVTDAYQRAARDIHLLGHTKSPISPVMCCRSSRRA